MISIKPNDNDGKPITGTIKIEVERGSPWRMRARAWWENVEPAYIPATVVTRWNV
jgi:hypothetical protein